jgi:hypothetical protein
MKGITKSAAADHQILDKKHSLVSASHQVQRVGIICAEKTVQKNFIRKFQAPFSILKRNHMLLEFLFNFMFFCY